MLNLVLCEFTKLKRKKIVLLIILSAFLFPVPLTAFMTLPFPIESEAANFNEYFSYVMGYGVELLLPCVIGITAANLFFMERDHDTFKKIPRQRIAETLGVNRSILYRLTRRDQPV